MTRILAPSLLLLACADPGSTPADTASSPRTSDAGAPSLDAAPPPDGPRVLEVVYTLEVPRAELDALLAADATIDNGYTIWRIRYRTDGATAMATVAVPLTEPPAGGWVTVVNNPYTNGVGDPCALGEWAAGAGLAGTFGARGMVGVAIDYPGLATPGVHPYLVARSEGRASLDAARAVFELDIPTNGRVVVGGVSQGGHATVAAAAQHATYAPELDIRGFVAIAPASVVAEQWSATVDVPGPHLVFHALLTYAWTDHYGYGVPSPWAEGLDIDALMSSRCLLTPTAEPDLAAALGADPRAIFAPDYLAAFAGGFLDAYPFLARGFAENRLVPYTQTAPLRIYQGDADDVVPEANTARLVADLRAGGVEVEYLVVPDGGHVDVAFGYVSQQQLRTDDALAWVRAVSSP